MIKNMLEVPTIKTRMLNHVDYKAFNTIQVAANKNIEDRYYILGREVAAMLYSLHSCLARRRMADMMQA